MGSGGSLRSPCSSSPPPPRSPPPARTVGRARGAGPVEHRAERGAGRGRPRRPGGDPRLATRGGAGADPRLHDRRDAVAGARLSGRGGGQRQRRLVLVPGRAGHLHPGDGRLLVTSVPDRTGTDGVARDGGTEVTSVDLGTGATLDRRAPQGPCVRRPQRGRVRSSCPYRPSAWPPATRRTRTSTGPGWSATASAGCPTRRFTDRRRPCTTRRSAASRA